MESGKAAETCAPFGFKVEVSESIPPTEALLMNPQYDPRTGELDVAATMRASVRIVNIGGGQ